MGGAVAAIDYMKRRLVESNTGRLSGIETGDLTVVGVNKWTETEPSPLTAGEGAIMVVDPAVEAAAGRAPQGLARGARRQEP